MNELTIQSNKFDEAKKRLKTFSNSKHSAIDLESVATHGGLFDWFEHRVTGIELNGLTAQIQKYLISINDMQIKSIKEFAQVYQALEALDEEYIPAILTAIKAAEEASAQAKKSANEAKKNSRDIKKAMEVQKETINVLTKFKNKIDEYEHLQDVDELWNDSQMAKKSIKDIKNELSDQKELTARENEGNRNDINNLYKKLRVSYLLAGVSIAIALISIVLNIFGVI